MPYPVVSDSQYHYLTDVAKGVHKTAAKIIIGEKLVDYKSDLQFLKINTIRNQQFALNNKFWGISSC